MGASQRHVERMGWLQDRDTRARALNAHTCVMVPKRAPNPPVRAGLSEPERPPNGPAAPGEVLARSAARVTHVGGHRARGYVVPTGPGGSGAVASGVVRGAEAGYSMCHGIAVMLSQRRSAAFPMVTT